MGDRGTPKFIQCINGSGMAIRNQTCVCCERQGYMKGQGYVQRLASALHSCEDDGRLLILDWCDVLAAGMDGVSSSSSGSE